jgi:hypothetical protein
MMQHLWLTLLGFVVGTFGTLIGAGGGFVLMPILLLLYPDESVDILTAISLAVVFFNALSGSWAYGRMGRIDYRSGLIFAAATVPGAILGALTTNYIPRRPFDAVLGVVMVGACLFLMLPQGRPKESESSPGTGRTRRRVVDAEGRVHTYAYDMRVGVGLSAVVGYVSSVLGIGGGIIHVPALARLLNFPVHLATATSHFILAIMAFANTVAHIAHGSFAQGADRTVFLSVGVLFGAQLGAWLSNRLHGRAIIRLLAAGLGFLGLRILLGALG